MKSFSPIYTSSMLWKPVVYQSADRSIEHTTLMQVGPIKNNIALEFLVDKGIFNALVNQSFVSGFNLTLGRTKDGMSIISRLLSLFTDLFLRFFHKNQLQLCSVNRGFGYATNGFHTKICDIGMCFHARFAWPCHSYHRTRAHSTTMLRSQTQSVR